MSGKFLSQVLTVVVAVIITIPVFIGGGLEHIREMWRDAINGPE